MGETKKRSYNPIRRAIKHILLEVNDQTSIGLIVLVSLKDLPGFLRCGIRKVSQKLKTKLLSKALFVAVLL